MAKDGSLPFKPARQPVDLYRWPQGCRCNYRQVLSRRLGTAASLYAYQAAPENLEQMTFQSPTSGERVNLAWQLPKTYGDPGRAPSGHRKMVRAVMRHDCRSPDHVASTLVGFRMGLAAFRDYDPKRAAALESYFQYARDNDLFLSYVIINPQSDKAKSAGETRSASGCLHR